MKLARNVDRLLLIVTVFLMSFVLAFAASSNNHDTFADNESGVYVASEDHFVIFYDEGAKLIVKTNAATVGEALSRAGYEITAADIVEPELNAAISSDNFFINIHRARPVVIRDGVREQYLMTASYDPRVIAKQAGMTVYDGDVVALAENTSFLETGAAEVYAVMRNGGRTVTVTEEIGFSEERVKDYDMAPGTEEVRQLGETGEKELVYEVFYENGEEVKRELVSEMVKREPVVRIVAVGASEIEKRPLTAAMGVNRYTVRLHGTVVERKETYYDLPMSGVMAIAARECGVEAYYTVREDGVKVDAEGYVLVAADLERYPRCSVVETSLGPGKVYDTGSFVNKPDGTGHEQFDIATDWTNRNGK